MIEPLVTPASPASAGAHARVLNVGLAGFGTVGQAVARILLSGHADRLRLTRICNRGVARKRVDWVPPHVGWTEEFDDLLAPDVDVVVELIGGVTPAGEWVERALASGRSVVTANKQLVARRATALLALARAHGAELAFEASVAGGVPVVRGLREGLAGDRLFRISGILNGTCNYILTRMESAGLPFEHALAEAQAAGFAEADPTEDVDGLDARAKLAILARVAFHTAVDPTQIPCRSIRPLEAIDFVYARHLKSAIRQVARLERDPAGALLAFVQPALVSVDSPLAGVHGSQNLVAATGEFGGETTFAGFGAGGNPTAVAVVSDLIAIARRHRKGGAAAPDGEAEAQVEAAQIESVARGFSRAADALPASIGSDLATPYYVRFTVKDRPGIIAALADAFCRHGINIDAVLQEPGLPKARLPFVVTLEECRPAILDEALKEIAGLDFHVEAPVALPILG